MTTEKTLPALSNSYVNTMTTHPILSKEEELLLAQRKDFDLEAAQKLILSHIRFVSHIAKGYAGYGFPHPELVQEGIVGLMKAVKKFDANHGVRLVSFAVHSIKSEIQEFILKNFDIVKVATTKNQRKLFFNIRKMRSGQMMSLTQSEAENISIELNVPVKDVIEMERRMLMKSTSVDSAATDDNDEPSKNLANILPSTLNTENDVSFEIDLRKIKGAALDVIGGMSDRHRIVLEERVLSEDKTTLLELSERLGVSSERVRQIESQSLKKIKNNLLERGFTSSPF